MKKSSSRMFRTCGMNRKVLHLLDMFNDLTQYEEQDGDGDNVRIEVEHGPRVILGHKKGV